MKNILSLFIILGFSISHASSDSIQKIYIDRAKNVHVVVGGQDRQLTTQGGAVDASVSENMKFAAWLTLNSWVAPGESEPSPSLISVFHDGRVQSVGCGAFIREYWFWRGGVYVAIDCGGLHFAGEEILYDARSLRKVDSFYQVEIPLEKRPEWSSSGTGRVDE